MKRRSGFYRTNLPGRAQYESFVPAALPPDPPLQLGAEISSLLQKVHQQLDQLQRQAAQINDLDHYLPLFLKREALLSIRTDGAGLDWQEFLKASSPAAVDAQNYTKALALGLDLLEELPLCLRLLRQVHLALLANARYEKLSPGEFRRSQNWLGDKESKIQTAWYVPPSLADMARALADLEEYIHQEDDLDDLLKAGLIHYQFFAIHPFLAGNNRSNRILTYLYLTQKKLLASPILTLSFYLSANPSDYYKKMLAIYNRGSYEEWLVFFLTALGAAAAQSSVALARLANWQGRYLAWLQEQGRAAANTSRVLVWFIANQPGTIKNAARELDLSRSTAARAVQRLLAAGILVQTEPEKGPAKFYLKELIDDLFEPD